MTQTTPSKPLLLLTSALLIGSILGLLLLNANKTVQSKHTLYVFGTEVNIQLVSNTPVEAQNAIQALETRFHLFHHNWHAWETGGIIAKMNQNIAQGKPFEVSLEVKRFIEKSQQLAKQSDSLFDPAIGALINLWGFHAEDWQGPPPSQEQINRLLIAAPSIADIQFNGLLLSSANPKVQLDFGGNAKGLAIDIASDLLKKHHILSALVSIGGDMKAIGTADQQWQIGIQSPFHKTGKAIASLSLSTGESVFTSGNYLRFFEWQGQRFSHLIHPKTGMPSSHFASVTIIHPDAITADAAATALSLTTPETWQTIAQKMGIDQALLIDQQGQFFMTPKMQHRIHLID